MDRIKIIIVSNISDFPEEITTQLEFCGITISAITSSSYEAIPLFFSLFPDLLIIDINIHGAFSGIKAVNIIKEKHDIPIIYIFDEYNEDLLNIAFKVGSHGFLLKPVTPDFLVLAVRHAMYLWKKENRLKEILHTLPDIVYETDEKGEITFISKNVSHVFGCQKNELKTVNDALKLLIPEDQKRAADNFLKTISGIPGKEMEYTIRSKSGNMLPISIMANPRMDGTVCKGTIGVIRDITERKTEQLRLFESEERYRTLVENINDVHAILDLSGFINYVSPSVERLAGYTCKEIIGKNFSEFVYPEDIPEVLKMFTNTLSGIRKPDEYRMIDKTGKIIWVRTSSSLIVKEGITIGISSLLTDITERRKLEEEIIHISEKERMRIGRDLHDGIGQYFSGIGYLFRTLIETLPKKTKKTIVAAEEIGNLISEAKCYVQMLSKGYNPVGIDSSGFIIAINELCSNIEKMYHVACTFLYGEDVAITDNETSIHLYYIINECINNAKKHGNAKNILVMLSRKENKYMLSIEDDGNGFDQNIKSSGLGLNIMKYRATIIGGTLKISSKPASGTTITCAFPVKKTVVGKVR